MIRQIAIASILLTQLVGVVMGSPFFVGDSVPQLENNEPNFDGFRGFDTLAAAVDHSALNDEAIIFIYSDAVVRLTETVDDSFKLMGLVDGKSVMAADDIGVTITGNALAEFSDVTFIATDDDSVLRLGGDARLIIKNAVVRGEGGSETFIAADSTGTIALNNLEVSEFGTAIDIANLSELSIVNSQFNANKIGLSIQQLSGDGHVSVSDSTFLNHVLSVLSWAASGGHLTLSKNTIRQNGTDANFQGALAFHRLPDNSAIHLNNFSDNGESSRRHIVSQGTGALTLTGNYWGDSTNEQLAAESWQNLVEPATYFTDQIDFSSVPQLSDAVSFNFNHFIVKNTEGDAIGRYFTFQNAYDRTPEFGVIEVYGENGPISDPINIAKHIQVEGQLSAAGVAPILRISDDEAAVGTVSRGATISQLSIESSAQKDGLVISAPDTEIITLNQVSISKANRGVQIDSGSLAVISSQVFGNKIGIRHGDTSAGDSTLAILESSISNQASRAVEIAGNPTVKISNSEFSENGSIVGIGNDLRVRGLAKMTVENSGFSSLGKVIDVPTSVPINLSLNRWGIATNLAGIIQKIPNHSILNSYINADGQVVEFGTNPSIFTVESETYRHWETAQFKVAPGGTVLVNQSTANFPSIAIEKPLTLRAERDQFVRLFGERYPITVATNNVVISGLEIVGNGLEGVGIKSDEILGGGVSFNVEKSVIRGFEIGIQLFNASDELTLRDVDINQQHREGVVLESGGHINFTEVSLSGNGLDGLKVNGDISGFIRDSRLVGNGTQSSVTSYGIRLNGSPSSEFHISDSDIYNNDTQINPKNIKTAVSTLKLNNNYWGMTDSAQILESIEFVGINSILPIKRQSIVNPESFRTVETTADGGWTDLIWRDTTTGQYINPDGSTILTIRHDIRLDNSALLNAVSVGAINIEETGSLTIEGETQSIVLSVHQLITVNGQLFVGKKGHLDFAGGDSSGIQLAETGTLVLGARDTIDRENWPSLNSSTGGHFSVELGGWLYLNQFEISNSSGLRLSPTAVVSAFSNGHIKDSSTSSGHIVSDAHLVLENIEFDLGTGTAGYNIVANDGAHVHALNISTHNSLGNLAQNEGVIRESLTDNDNQSTGFGLGDGGDSVGGAAGDINGDGWVDLFVSNLPSIGREGATTLGRLYINEGGKFRPSDALNDPELRLNIGYLFDVDHDGDLDLVGIFNSQFRLLINTGRGAFFNETNRWLDESLSEVNNISAGDYNRDGHLDLVVTRKTRDLILLQVPKDSRFQVVTTSQNSDSLFNLMMDVDHDGLTDVMTLKPTSLHIDFQTLTGAQNLMIYDRSDFSSLTLTHTGIDIGDLNQDGNLDAFLSTDDGTIVIGTGTFSQQGVVKNKNSLLFEARNDGQRDGLSSGFLHDSDGDYRPDIQFLGPFGQQVNYSDSFQRSDLLSHSQIDPVPPLIADFNRDGIPDRYVPSKKGANGLYLGEPSSVGWLRLQLESDGAIPYGTRVKVEEGGKIGWHYLMATRGIYRQDGSDIWIPSTRGNIDALTVYFPSGKSIERQNISVSGTASLLMSETGDYPGLQVSGRVFGRNQQPLSLPATISASAPGVEPVTAEIDSTGQYNLGLPAAFSEGTVGIKVGNSSGFLAIQYDNQRLSSTEANDFVIDLDLFEASGSVLYKGYPASNIELHLSRYHPDGIEIDDGVSATLISRDGQFSGILGAGEWVGSISFDGEYLGPVGPFSVTPASGIPEIIIDQELNDSVSPTLTFTNFQDETQVSGAFKFEGEVSDNLAIKSITMRAKRLDKVFEVNGETDFLIIETQLSTHSDAATWTTTRFPDGQYAVTWTIEDAAGNINTQTFNNIEIKNLSTEDFQHRFSGGTQESPRLHMFSLPFNQTELISTLKINDADFAAYDGAHYILGNQGDGTLNSGQGYWLRLNDSQDLDINLSKYDAHYQPVSLPLNAGWQLIGNPFHYPISIDNATFNLAGLELTYGQAVTQGLIVDGIWDWRQSVGTESYVFINDRPILDPWKSYWLRVIQPTVITYLPEAVSTEISTNSRSHRLFASESNGSHWQATLVLKEGNMIVDASNIIGVHPLASDNYGALDILEPPVVPTTIQSTSGYIVHDDWAEHNGQYAVDIRHSLDANNEWEFRVDFGDNRTDDVFLEIEDRHQIPDSHSIRIWDPVKARWIDLTVRGAYQMNPKEYPKVAEFRVAVRDIKTLAAESEFQLKNLRAYPNPFNPISKNIKERTVNIQYQLSHRASGTLNLVSVSGRKIRTFEIDSVQNGAADDLNVIQWDGRDEWGRLLPNDVYFYFIDIKDEFDRSIRKKGKIVIWKK